MMKKTIRIFAISIGLIVSACATKEELDPTLLEKPLKASNPTTKLQDSPTCVIAKQNYIVIQSQKPLDGIYGNLDISSSAFGVSLDRGSSGEKFFTVDDYFGNGRMFINFGDFNLATGIYVTTTNSKGYYDDYAGIRYISMRLATHNYWSSSIPAIDVAKGQKVLVVFDDNTQKARIKFCNAALVLPSNNSGNITGEISVACE